MSLCKARLPNPTRTYETEHLAPFLSNRPEFVGKRAVAISTACRCGAEPGNKLLVNNIEHLFGGSAFHETR